MTTRQSESTWNYRQNLPHGGDYEVVVCGGGPAGFAAGISAARLGAKTILLEATGALGGMATQGLVTSYDGMADGSQPLVGGIMQEILDRMQAAGLKEGHPSTWREKFLAPTKIKPEETKRFFDAMAEEAGLEVRFFTRAVDVARSTDELRIRGVVVSDIDGLRVLGSQAVVDASGDATVVARSGAACHKALRDTPHVMPATLCFIIANIDEKRKDHPRNYLKQASADNHFSFRDPHLLPSRIADGVASFNAGHIHHFDPTDPEAHSKAMVFGRKIADELVRFLRIYVPGYERCELVSTAPLLGVRESRRVIGECELTWDDYISARHFPDQIGIFNKEPDCHVYDPTPENLARHREERGARIGWLPPGRSYGLPYGILVPRGSVNLWVAGRCVSTDVQVQSSSRVMPAAAMMGEAAGAAAAQHVQTGQAACDLRTDTLVQTLRSQGAILPQEELSPAMTRGSGHERGRDPVVRMSFDKPLPTGFQNFGKKTEKKREAVLLEPTDPPKLRSCIQNTCAAMRRNCCRSLFANADEVLSAIDAEAERCSDGRLMPVAQRLKGCIDTQCCQASFEDDGRLAEEMRHCKPVNHSSHSK